MCLHEMVILREETITRAEKTEEKRRGREGQCREIGTMFEVPQNIRGPRSVQDMVRVRAAGAPVETVARTE